MCIRDRDEALGFCAVDVSGRPYLVFDAAFPQERVGDFDTCMTEDPIEGVVFGLFAPDTTEFTE